MMGMFIQIWSGKMTLIQMVHQMKLNGLMILELVLMDGVTENLNPIPMIQRM